MNGSANGSTRWISGSMACWAERVNAPIEIDTKDIMRITYEHIDNRTDGILHMITGSEYRVGQPTVTDLKALDPALADREVR